MNDRIEHLRTAVQVTSRRHARHIESVPVVEMMGDKTVWEGVVEVFQISGHAKAERCYAWSYGEGKGKQLVTILEIPPVTDAVTAVRASIMAAARGTASPAKSMGTP